MGCDLSYIEKDSLFRLVSEVKRESFFHMSIDNPFFSEKSGFKGIINLEYKK